MRLSDEGRDENEKKAEKIKKSRYQLGADPFPKSEESYYYKQMLRYQKCRITVDIAADYRKKASGKSLNEIIELRNELMEIYGVTELEATNILNGFHTADYAKKYEDISKGIFYNVFGPDSHRGH